LKQRTARAALAILSGVWKRVTAVAALLAVALAAPAVARGDWNGDGPADVLTIHSDGRLLMYRGNGASGWITGAGEQIAGGWTTYTALMAPGDWSGDGNPDLVVRRDDGALILYRGNGKGGFATGLAQQIGGGWGPFTAIISPGDFTGDGNPDILARQADGVLLLYRGDGDGYWITGAGERIDTGWHQFSAIVPAGDFSGDGHPDVLAVLPEGRMFLFRGNGHGGWAAAGQSIDTGWGSYTALFGGGDFSGDGRADLLARRSDGVLVLRRGNGAGGWLTGFSETLGSGWDGLNYLTLAPGTPAAGSGAAPEPGPAPAAPLPDGNVSLTAGVRCTPPGGRLRVSLSVRRRAGRAAPRVSRVVFFVRNGPRRTDRRRPYVVRLRMNRPAGQRGRVYARVYYRRAGSRKLHTKTVSRRFAMCS
jgi:hypothetical protein